MQTLQLLHSSETAGGQGPHAACPGTTQEHRPQQCLMQPSGPPRAQRGPTVPRDTEQWAGHAVGSPAGLRDLTRSGHHTLDKAVPEPRVLCAPGRRGPGTGQRLFSRPAGSPSPLREPVNVTFDSEEH